MKISIDRKSSTPIYIQIKEKIKELIASGYYRNGDYLPPTRTLAEGLGIHRNTAITAYKALEAEGFVFSHVGRGTFIIEPEKMSPNNEIAFHNMFNWTHHISARLKQRISHKLLTLYQSENSQAPISFVWHQKSSLDFPVQKMQRAINSIIRNKGDSIMNYSSPIGNFDLRLILSNRMRMKGIHVSPENILIVSGAQQGMDIIGRLLIEPGDKVVVENPTYTGALCSFQFLQARIIGIPVDEWGMKTHLLEEILKKYHPKFIFTIPTFHNPTGTTMRKDRREHIISLAMKYQIPIIEDDYASDLRFSGAEVPPLKALDISGQVIYVGTFSKVLIPGLRVGWIAASKDIIESLAELKRINDLCTSPFIQAIITEFHARGYIASHLRFLKRMYHRKFQILYRAIRQYFPKETIMVKPEGGIYHWITLPVNFDLREVWKNSRKRGVTFCMGNLFYLDEKGSNQIRLQFTLEEEEKIVGGIKIIGEEIKKSISS